MNPSDCVYFGISACLFPYIHSCKHASGYIYIHQCIHMNVQTLCRSVRVTCATRTYMYIHIVNTYTYECMSNKIHIHTTATCGQPRPPTTHHRHHPPATIHQPPPLASHQSTPTSHHPSPPTSQPPPINHHHHQPPLTSRHPPANSRHTRCGAAVWPKTCRHSVP